MNNELILLLVVTLAGALLSLIGGIYLLKRGTLAKRLRVAAVPFAAGALLAAAFLDVLPEALHDGEPRMVLFAALVGFLLFLVLERSADWFHHHHDEHEKDEHSRRTVWLVVAGDTLHNLIDGLAIGAAFVISPAVGVVTALAIAAHELPQEMGDFGLMLAKGMRPRKVLVVNIVSSLATLVGAIAVYSLGSQLTEVLPLLLGLAGGFFIYIAASDIVPAIQATTGKRGTVKTVILLVGIIVVGAISSLAHSVLPEGAHGHSDHSEVEHDEEHADHEEGEDHHDDHDTHKE